MFGFSSMLATVLINRMYSPISNYLQDKNQTDYLMLSIKLLNSIESTLVNQQLKNSSLVHFSKLTCNLALALTEKLVSIHSVSLMSNKT